MIINHGQPIMDKSSTMINLTSQRSPRSPRSPERRGSHVATARLHVRDAVQDAAAAAVPRPCFTGKSPRNEPTKIVVESRFYIVFNYAATMFNYV